MATDDQIPEGSLELERQFSSLVDGTLPAEEQERLEEMLIHDREARGRYRDFLRMEYILAWEILYGEVRATGGRVARKSEAGDSVSMLVGDEPTSHSSPLWTGLSHGRWAIAGVTAAAATLMVALFLAFGTAPPDSTAPVAMLTASRDARWQTLHEPRAGGPLPDGPLRLAAGTAQITFRHGAIVTLHGPAQVEVLSRDRLFLRSGRITTFVPPAAKGFTVVSPSGEVVDFGTEFAMGVAADGKTDVFVIDGRVDVKGGHESEQTEAVKLTQGYATRFSAADPAPTVTHRPLFVEHFDGERATLELDDADPSQKSFVRGGSLWIPIDGRSDRPSPLVRTALARDLSPMRGHRSVLSAKVTLPQGAAILPSRWLAVVLDDATAGPTPSNAWDTGAGLAVLVSPKWQVGSRYSGEVGYLPPVFSRRQDAVGPYQLVISIDDSPASHARHGGTTATVMVNGLEVITDKVIVFTGEPRISLQTSPGRPIGDGRGIVHALVDDFSLSIEDEASERP